MSQFETSQKVGLNQRKEILSMDIQNQATESTGTDEEKKEESTGEQTAAPEVKAE